MATPVQQSETAERPAGALSPAWAFAALLLLALLLRVGLALAYPTLDWPDEVFQTTEPAHRLAFGNGVVTWEWRDGSRNWALPAALALAMRLTAWTGPGSTGYTRALAVLLSILSLAVVWVAYRWGSRAMGSRAGLLAAMTCAVWYDLVYYGPKPLNEVVAAHLLVAGLYLAYWHDAPRARARLLAAGVLLGAVVGLRMQLGPAVAVALALLFFRLPRPRWTLLLLAAVGCFCAFGLLDAITWAYPFSSYVRSLQVNLLQGKSAIYGVLPWYWYGSELTLRVGWLLPFAVLGARRSPFLAAVAAAVLLTHLPLAHKEYRFIFPAVALIVILGGLGVAEFAAYLQKLLQPSARAPAIAAILVALLSVYTWKSALVRSTYDGALPAFQSLSNDGSACGVGLRGPWFWSGGYTYLHRKVPLIPVGGPEDTEITAAFNVLVTSDGWRAHPEGYQLERCWGHACVYRRPGGCLRVPPREINAVLRAAGK